MKAVKTPDGLYTFPLKIKFNNIEKTFNGLVDTGSNACACSYRIITTFRAKPSTYATIANPLSSMKTLGYSFKMGFDGKSMMTHVYRLPFKGLPGIDFILGLSILSHCKVTLNDDHMDITWNS